MISKKKIEQYKKRLEEDKKRILAEIEAGKQTEEFGDDVDHFEEEADEAEEIGNQLVISQTLKDQISQIDIALNRMETGEYGLCENCHREIEEKILDLVPESHLCQKCKKENPKY